MSFPGLCCLLIRDRKDARGRFLTIAAGFGISSVVGLLVCSSPNSNSYDREMSTAFLLRGVAALSSATMLSLWLSYHLQWLLPALMGILTIVFLSVFWEVIDLTGYRLDSLSGFDDAGTVVVSVIEGFALVPLVRFISAPRKIQSRKAPTERPQLNKEKGFRSRLGIAFLPRFYSLCARLPSSRLGLLASERRESILGFVGISVYGFALSLCVSPFALATSRSCDLASIRRFRADVHTCASSQYYQVLRFDFKPLPPASAARATAPLRRGTI